MNRRLEQFLKAENISQSQFADSIGVARASVSHILAGRNRPGFDFLLNMAKAYPTLNLEWLITGKGRMYSAGKAPTTLFETEDDSAPENSLQARETAPTDIFAKLDVGAKSVPEAPISKAIASANHTQSTESKRNISKIVVFYDDNTFQEYQKAL